MSSSGAASGGCDALSSSTKPCHARALAPMRTRACKRWAGRRGSCGAGRAHLPKVEEQPRWAGLARRHVGRTRHPLARKLPGRAQVEERDLALGEQRVRLSRPEHERLAGRLLQAARLLVVCMRSGHRGRMDRALTEMASRGGGSARVRVGVAAHLATRRQGLRRPPPPRSHTHARLVAPSSHIPDDEPRRAQSVMAPRKLAGERGGPHRVGAAAALRYQR